MDLSIRIRCPGCNARIKADFQLLGQTRSCPRCRSRLLIQTRPPEDCDAMLLEDDSGVYLSAKLSKPF